MKVKLSDGTELECSVNEFIEFQTFDTKKLKNVNDRLVEEKLIKPNKTEKLSTIQETTKILNYIQNNPMETINDIAKKLDASVSYIYKVIKVYGGIKGIRKNLNLPKRQGRLITDEQKNKMSYISKKGNYYMKNEGLTRTEAFKKAAKEWKNGGTQNER